MKPSIPRGTRDMNPAEMQKRNYIFDVIKKYFRLYGFEQIETPAMENLSSLTGKYGEEGDQLLFVSKETGEEFGGAVITSLHSKTLGTLTDADWEGHERFASEEEMYKTYRGYYGDRVNEESVVKILSFDFQPFVKT